MFLPLRDSIDEDITPVFTQFMQYYDESITANKDAKFYVHCQAGVSRSASLIIALLMTQQHQSFDLFKGSFAFVGRIEN